LDRVVEPMVMGKRLWKMLKYEGFRQNDRCEGLFPVGQIVGSTPFSLQKLTMKNLTYTYHYVAPCPMKNERWSQSSSIINTKESLLCVQEIADCIWIKNI